MAFSEEFIQKVLNTADIVEVIGEFVNLKKAGVNYKGLCPFHNEKTPSFIVSPSKNIFKCFGCGEHGSVVGFLMKHEKLSFTEAIRWLANKYHIPIEEKELSDEEKKELAEKDTLFIINQLANEFYKNNLYSTQLGRNLGYGYFKSRGFTDEIIKKFELGFALDAKRSFTDYALSKGYKIENLAKAGLTIVKDNDYYDRFRNRVIFPIHTLGGRVVGFAGRILGNSQSKNAPKYLNSPETIIYQKRFLLYGLHLAKNQIIKEDKCYLVEGYTDVISMHQAGITNVVASAGTSLTSEQIRIIRRFTRNLTLIFDGDKAGLNAAIRGVDLVLQEDMNVRIVVLPENEDPDSFTKNNYPDVVKSYIDENEQDFIKFKIHLLLSEAEDDPVRRAYALRSIATSLAFMPDELKRSVYITEAAKLLDVQEKTLLAEVNKIILKQKKDAYFKNKRQQELSLRQSPPLPSHILSIDVPHEKEILFFLLNFGSHTFINSAGVQTTIANYIITELQNDQLEFVNLKYRKLFEEYEKLSADVDSINPVIFTNYPDPEISEVAAEILSDDFYLADIWLKPDENKDKQTMSLQEAVKRAIFAYKRKILDLEIDRLQKLLKDEPLSEQQYALIEKIQNLTILRNELTKQTDNRVIF